MANFKYTAISKDGTQVNGVIQARDTTDAIIELKDTVETVIEIKEISETAALLGGSILNAEIGSSKIKDKELALVCKQFSIILHAGLPIVRATRLVGEQCENKTLQKLLIDVSEDVRGGMSMADAYESRGENLPSTFIETIRAGELSGKLDVAYERLSTYFGKKAATSSKVISALLYPAFVLLIAVVVVAIIMIKAVPMFTETFIQLDLELPFVTKMIIAISNFFVKWWWLLLLIIAILVAAYLYYRSTEEGLLKTETIKLGIPILGPIYQMTAATEFATSFSTMLAAGLPTVKALSVAAKAMTNYRYQNDIERACGLVESGHKISDSLRQETVLPNLLLEITGVGEESGSLESTLTTISEYYDNEVDTVTTRAVTLLEPITIVFLAVIVVIILLAVYLPMFSMYSAF